MTPSRVVRVAALAVLLVAGVVLLVVGVAGCDTGGYYPDPGTTVIVHQHTTVHAAPRPRVCRTITTRTRTRVTTRTVCS